MVRWAILTGEYPPDCGGVADYTAQVAAALAASGDDVTIVRPPSDRPPVAQDGVRVMTLPDHFGPSARRELSAWLRASPAPHRLLVQYVPGAFGSRGMNLAFCRWLLGHSRASHDDVCVMFHEPYFYFGWSRPHRNGLAIVQRAMAAVLLRAADQVYLSTDRWRDYLHRYGRPAFASTITLPIPSAVPPCTRPADAERLRAILTRGTAGKLVGHFGTFGDHIAPLLRAQLGRLLALEPSASAVCIGDRSEGFVRDMLALQPGLESRLVSTGRLDADAVAVHLRACDLLIQPYPDGVTTRRTSVMAGLVNARPVLTTDGALTEPVWRRTGAVALVPAAHPEHVVEAARRLLADPSARADLAARGEATYRSIFALEHTIARLRDRVAGAAA